MKKRFLGMSLLIATCSMTIACQPRTPKATLSPQYSELQQTRTNCDQDELDSDAYGANDTTSANVEMTAPVLSEIQQVLEVNLTQEVEELQESGEPNTDVVSLEAVKPVEIEPQFQNESEQN